MLAGIGEIRLPMEHPTVQYASTSPRLWLPYVDDTFLFINRTEQDNFLNTSSYINSINSHIKLTQEECLDNKLAFLDCNIKISDACKLTTAVYRSAVLSAGIVVGRPTLATTYSLGRITHLSTNWAGCYVNSTLPGWNGCQWSTWSFFEKDHIQFNFSKSKIILIRFQFTCIGGGTGGGGQGASVPSTFQTGGMTPPLFDCPVRALPACSIVKDTR